MISSRKRIRNLVKVEMRFWNGVRNNCRLLNPRPDRPLVWVMEENRPFRYGLSLTVMEWCMKCHLLPGVSLSMLINPNWNVNTAHSAVAFRLMVKRINFNNRLLLSIWSISSWYYNTSINCKFICDKLLFYFQNCVTFSIRCSWKKFVLGYITTIKSQKLINNFGDNTIK